VSERVCDVRDLGRTPYGTAMRLQEELVERRRAGEIRDTLLFVEHPPVVTIGRGVVGSAEVDGNLLRAAGVEVYEVTRGGKTTWHGPGQIVGYPILDLRGHRQDLHWYLRALEDVLIAAVARFGYRGGRVDGLTGVWIGDRKVASIGIAVRGWVTYHGFALNVACEGDPWRLIDPCGLRPEQMASLADLPGEAVEMCAMRRAVAEEFGALFDLEMRWR